MKEGYTIKAHQTIYKSTVFRSRLEATWAAFFDFAGWKWDYEPVDLEVDVDGQKVWWDPDFLVKIPCGHTECGNLYVWENGRVKKDNHGCVECQLDASGKPMYVEDFTHDLYVEVKPYMSISEFDDHIVNKIIGYDIPSPAMFGINPDVTSWTMAHGSGGGTFHIGDWLHGRKNELWAKAKFITQWKR